MIPFSALVESRTDVCWIVWIIYNTGWVEVPLRFSFDGSGWLEGVVRNVEGKGGEDEVPAFFASLLLAWMAHVSPTQKDVGCCGDRAPTITRSCVTHVQTRVCPIVPVITTHLIYPNP
jgi:hypothetical protein